MVKNYGLKSRIAYPLQLSQSVWIRDKMVRIRIRGSVPLTYGSGSESKSDSWSGSCSFHQWFSRCQQKRSFFPKFLSYYHFLKVHLHQSSEIKSNKEVTVEIKVFPTFLLNNGSIQIRLENQPTRTEHKYLKSGKSQFLRARDRCLFDPWIRDG
jgi:hypothetical protein